MKRLFSITIFLFLIIANTVFCQLYTKSNQWTATDGLGRTLPNASVAGVQKPNKLIGIFYWDWHNKLSERYWCNCSMCKKLVVEIPH